MYFRSVAEIKQNWPVYRCNPPYWIYSDDIGADFTYCVQNTQINMFGSLLEPLNYMLSSVTGIAGELAGSINSVREMFSFMRLFNIDSITNIFGVFLNSSVALQTMGIKIKDIVGKVLGVVITLMYGLDGAIKTMGSTWNGKPGQLIRAIGSCFHPDTKVKLKNGTVYCMKDLPLGSELEDGSKIFSVMKIANFNNEPLFKIKGGVNGEYIYVTGSHFIFNKDTNKWIQVKDSPDAIVETETETAITSDWFSCLITTNRQIKIGEQLFWDWEDDELLEKKW